MTSIDPFGRTDQLDEATLEALASRFEARGRHSLFAAMLDEYLAEMDIDGADTVLDMGCGTGLAARAIVRRPGFAGRVVAVDLSAHLVTAAERLAGEEGVADRIDFITGDTSRLAEPDGGYDAVVAHTLLSHVEEPSSVLREAARVLAAGGLLGVFDGDYASLTFGHADPVVAKRYDDAVVSAVVTNPRVMRQMPRLLRQTGFELVASFSHVLSEAGTADFWLSAIEAYRRLIPKTGVMTAREADAWAANLRDDANEGVFFGSSNYYAYVARRSPQ